MKNTTALSLFVVVLAALLSACEGAVALPTKSPVRLTAATLLDVTPWHSDSNVLLASDSGKLFVPPTGAAFPATIEVRQGLPLGTYCSMVNMTGIDVRAVGVTILVDLDHGGSTSMTSAEKFGVLNLREIGQDVFLMTREEPKEPAFP